MKKQCWIFRHVHVYMTNVKTSAENRHEKDWHQQQETHILNIIFCFGIEEMLLFFVHYKIYQQKGCPGDNIYHPNLYRFLNYSTSWFIQEKRYKYMSVLTASGSSSTIDCLSFYIIHNCVQVLLSIVNELVNKWAGRRFLHHHVTLWRQLLPQFKYLLLVLLLYAAMVKLLLV